VQQISTDSVEFGEKRLILSPVYGKYVMLLGIGLAMNYFKYKRMISICALFFTWISFWAPQNIFSQNRGLKYIKNYTTGMHSVNWSILQDKRGVIYVANQGCIFEFDGASQRIINIPGWKVLSLGMDNKGTVYVGGSNELGYLAAGGHGTRQYVSLVKYIPANQRNFSNVRRINITNDGIYFRTKQYLFRWNPETKKIDVLEPEKEFNASFDCNGILYIHQQKVGLMQMKDGSPEMIAGDETFASAKIYMITPFAPDSPEVLIGTRSKGFYIYDGLTAKPFLTEVDDYVKEKQLYHGIKLNSYSPTVEFALATQGGGLVIIDSSGKLKQIFTKACGLQDDVVNYVYQDSQGNLWLALDKGLSKIEYSSPISFYNQEFSNLRGIVYSTIRHGSNNNLLAGASTGLYVLQSPTTNGTPGGPVQFQQIPGITGNCWDILSVGDSLMAATSDSVFLLGKNFRVKEKVIQMQSYVFHRLAATPNRVLVGTRRGVYSLRPENSGWVKEFHFENISDPIRTIAKDKNGNLWLGTEVGEVLKIDFPKEGEIIHHLVTRYNDSHGLPDGEVRVFNAAGHVIFAAEKKIYKFDEKSRNFVLDYTLGKGYVDGSRSVFTLAEDKKKNIWFHSEFRNFQAIAQPDGTFFINKKPFLRIPNSQVNTIYPDPGGDIIWFGGQDGLIRYDLHSKKNYDEEFSVFIREVVVNGTPLMYDEEKGKYKTKHTRHGVIPIIPYKDRNLIFKFAAPTFEDEESNTYRCLLEGYDEKWSEWNSEPKKVYTNLHSGAYTFRVQAKNVYGHTSHEASFQVKILAPWYSTWWALLSFVFGFFFLVSLINKWWRYKMLTLEKQKLEGIVKDRTKEINEKNQQLENQTLQLKEQSVKLQEMADVKSRFFANISHEFRTPLTLIMGPIEQMQSRKRDKEEEKQLNGMMRNSQRLLTLINQLLDLSRFDSGRMQLQTTRQDIVPFLKGILASFESLAGRNKIDLKFSTEAEKVFLYFDPEKMEEIICNLVANAVKFTPGGGTITISAKTIPTKEEMFPEGFLELSVSDTGIGIPKDQLAHIFDRFYKARGAENHNLKGTGIGLALTKELVNLHHGKIDVQSTEGKGTEFIIRLPLGKAHLKPGEIVAFSEIPSNRKKPGEISALYIKAKAEKEIEPAIPEENEKDIEPNTQGKDVILVVEDNDDARQYIRGAIEPFYIVKDAVDGNDGIDKAKKIIPDLVVSDVMMPGADGYELCNVLKNDIKTSHIPIILLTAKASEESVIQGLETGADDYIAKPFSTKILLARIKSLIDLRRLWQQKMQREMTLQPAEVKVSSMDQKFLKEVQEVIEKNLSDEFFNVDQLGKKLYMSRTTLYRKILALTGQTPRDFIKSYRLKRGAQLLNANFGNVTEVAFEVGFSSTTYFSKCFKEKFQQLPSDFHGSEEK
jgi:signal transduction histidine kinase/DNA-binding response OmpR family regulator